MLWIADDGARIEVIEKIAVSRKAPPAAVIQIEANS